MVRLTIRYTKEDAEKMDEMFDGKKSEFKRNEG